MHYTLDSLIAVCETHLDDSLPSDRFLDDVNWHRVSGG